jgi:hypothetical protein
MPVGLYMDVHVPMAITDQLRRRGVDVVTANELRHSRLPDNQLLSRASEMGRLLFTHDIRFRVMAEQWQREEESFAGLLYGHAEGASIGQYVRDLELIAKASEPGEWQGVVGRLPL